MLFVVFACVHYHEHHVFFFIMINITLIPIKKEKEETQISKEKYKQVYKAISIAISHIPQVRCILNI